MTSFNHILQILRPPDSHLWRARLSGSWNARYKPMPIRSCRGSAWGSEETALFTCIRYAWQCYLNANGYEKAGCPIKGLFNEQVPITAQGGKAPLRSWVESVVQHCLTLFTDSLCLCMQQVMSGLFSPWKAAFLSVAIPMLV